MDSIDNRKSEYEVVSYLTMRKTVGWLGMLLPFLLLFGNYFLNHSDIFNNEWFMKINAGYHYTSSWKNSVSRYYYTTVGEIFSGVLFAVAFFMFCYTGHPMREGDIGFSDSTMTNMAGFFALGVALFPTTADVPLLDNMRNFISSEYIGWIHYTFAGLFFLTLAFMSIINFRRSKDQNLFGQGDDDPFFKRCGIIMIACIMLVPIFTFLIEPTFHWANRIHSTFILEAIALITFGLSWLKKGKADLMYLPKKLGLKKD